MSFTDHQLDLIPRLLWFQGLRELHILHDLTAARRSLRQYAGARDSDPVTCFWLAETYEQLGNHAKAVLWWTEADAGLRFLNRGDTLEELGNLEKAENAYLTAVEIDPALGRAYIGLARISEAEERWNGAVTYYREAIKLNQERADVYYATGRVLNRELQRPREAVSLFTQGVQRDPGYIWNYVGAERAYRSLGDFRNALYWLRQADEAFPDSALPHIEYGYFYLGFGDLQKALTHFEEALVYDPSQRGIYYQIARIMRQRGELQAATSFYLESIKLSPDFFAALVELGDTYAEMGRLSDACRYYERAIEVKPADPMVMNRLASNGCDR